MQQLFDAGHAMACGSAQLTADLLTGREPAIRHDDLAWQRYGAERRMTGGRSAQVQPEAA